MLLTLSHIRYTEVWAFTLGQTWLSLYKLFSLSWNSVTKDTIFNDKTDYFLTVKNVTL